MNSRYTQALQQAAALLQRGAAADCAGLCEQLLQQMPGEANAMQLLGEAQQRLGALDKAEKTFAAALRAAPRHPPLLVAYARLLRTRERGDEAERCLREALAVQSGFAPAWHALALLLFSRGDYVGTGDCAQRLVELAATNPAGWELAAAAAQKRGDLQAALTYCRDGLRHCPRAARLHYSRGQLLREDCDFALAADAYERAEQLGFKSPDLYRNRAEALLEAGDIRAAGACADAGVERFPEHAPLQLTAARLAFSGQTRDDPLDRLRAAARQRPENAGLWQALVELMRRLNQHADVAETLAEAQRLGCPTTPPLAVLDALDRAERGHGAAAIDSLETLGRQLPDNTYVQHNLAMQLLRSGDPRRAEVVCAQGLERFPHDQTFLAYRGTALQLLDDPREAELLDYERMVVPVAVPVPDGYADREAFFSDLRIALEAQHHAVAQPINQSVRGGTQTNGFLFRLKDPILALLEQQIRKAIVSALDRFPIVEGHPFWGRRHADASGDGLRFSGAWSVRLRDQGFHTNHIHTEGWVSSALYISLPEEVQQGEGTEGHIQFGTPMTELGLDLAPRRIVRPEVGTLVLFPSYMWHGTLPFQSDQPRITVAFDLLPVR